MKELKDIIAENLVQLRRANSLTQSCLAEKLNYSDKAISKWENGESLPGIEVLQELCTLYGVTLDYLVSEQKVKPVFKEEEIKRIKQKIANHIAITCLAVMLVWFVAIALYVSLLITLKINYWLVFLWSIPASCVVAVVFNAIWGKRRFMYILTSILVWSVLLTLFFQLKLYNAWPMFLIGVPSQIAIILWSKLKRVGKICHPSESVSKEQHKSEKQEKKEERKKQRVLEQTKQVAQKLALEIQKADEPPVAKDEENDKNA